MLAPSSDAIRTALRDTAHEVGAAHYHVPYRDRAGQYHDRAGVDQTQLLNYKVGRNHAAAEHHREREYKHDHLAPPQALARQGICAYDGHEQVKAGAHARVKERVHEAGHYVLGLNHLRINVQCGIDREKAYAPRDDHHRVGQRLRQYVQQRQQHDYAAYRQVHVHHYVKRAVHGREPILIKVFGLYGLTLLQRAYLLPDCNLTPCARCCLRLPSKAAILPTGTG